MTTYSITLRPLHNDALPVRVLKCRGLISMYWNMSKSAFHIGSTYGHMNVVHSHDLETGNIIYGWNKEDKFVPLVSLNLSTDSV